MKRTNLAVLAVLILMGIGSTGCGSDKSTPWEGPPGAPVVNTGGGWGNTPVGGQPSSTPTPTYHNTKFCQVDENGNITSKDQIASDPGDDPAHGYGGACIERPIREVWAVMLNPVAMKPSQVDEYSLQDRCPITGTDVIFCFDFNNVVHALGGLINPTWTVRWYHAVTFGTYQEPDEIAANFQKTEGTTHIDSMKGGYVLDRVSDTVTSFAMDEVVKADSQDHNSLYQDVVDSIHTMRTGAPDWSYLPDTPESATKTTEPDSGN